MLAGYSPILQSLLGSLFTWAVTAVGASLVFFFERENLLLLDASLGFAAGVMMAASFWSLLAPALEITQVDYGSFGFVPVALGFTLGALFVYTSEKLLTKFGFVGFTHFIEKMPPSKRHYSRHTTRVQANGDAPLYPSTYCPNGADPSATDEHTLDNGAGLRSRKRGGTWVDSNGDVSCCSDSESKNSTVALEKYVTFRRVFLLILAVTVHNIPEGLAVGVGFGAAGKTASATFQKARNLAIGIGLQNFPEGFAVSLPLLGLGYSKWTSFWYGQLSGAVEPLAALLGALAVRWMEPLLPYALSFAAGAMIFVVLDDIVPEGQKNSNGKVASWMAMLGFVVMMSLDVGLG